MVEPRTYREFDCYEDAMIYRRRTGCGGWIFAADSGPAFIFPPMLTPTAIMLHPLTRGLDGQLYC